MESLQSSLLGEGWHLKQASISSLKGTKNSIDGIKSQALNEDISEIGEKYIQDALSSCKSGVLVGPCVLQVVKIRNISAPKDNEHSSVAPRMLKLSLTDGSNTVTAIEYEQLRDVSLKTAPGTKVKLMGRITLSSGTLQLTNSCFKVLGGRVEKLYSKWKISEDMNAISRMNIQTDDGPPPFVAFGKRGAGFKKYDKPKKSLQDNSKEEDADNSGFSVQRKTAIAEANKSDNKKELLIDPREKFGMRPPSEPKLARSYNAKPHHEDPKVTIEPKNSTGIYRELPTAGGQNVHQNTLKEFVEMGFKRDEVVLCLQKTNNDFEETMNLLTETPSPTPAPVDRNARSDNPRGRRGGGRGRARGKRDYDSQEQDNQSANPATLMDFIDQRMSNMLVKDTGKYPSYEREAFDGGAERQSNSYGGYKRGGYGRQSSHQYDHKNNRNPTHSSDGNTWQSKHSYDRNTQRNDGDKWQTNHSYDQNVQKYDNARRYQGSNNNSQRGSKHQSQAKPRSGQSHPEMSANNNRGVYDDGRRNQGSGSNSQRDSKYQSQPKPRSGQSHPGIGANNDQGAYDDARRNQGYGNNSQRDSNYQSESKTRSGQSHPPASANNNRDMYNNDRRNQGLSNNSQRDSKYQSQSKPRSGQSLAETGANAARNSSKPPRHQKHNDNSRQRMETSDTAKKSDSQVVFNDIPVNPPPQRGPTTFGGGASSDNAPGNRSSTGQGYERPRNIAQSLHVIIPQWQAGHHCFAKYWEDSQYYLAVITDLHPSAPTAVVQFVDFGNYEEVPLFDLKSVEAAANQAHGEGTQHNTAVSYPNDRPQYGSNDARRHLKPPMALYVPPKYRENQ